MLNLIDAIILGIVEGITEFLPISSTAHLMLAAEILKLGQTEFMKSFEIIIQLGAILAVVVLYWKLLLDFEVIKRLIVAFIPTGIIGLIFYKLVKNYFLENISVVLWSLFLGGVFLVIFEKYFAGKIQEKETEVKNISYPKCLVLGLFQSIAIVPGVSRSAATIVGGLALRIPRKTIVEFSFLLAVPTMFAATGLDLVKNINTFDVSQIQFLAVGFIVSFLMAIIAIRWLLGFIKKNTFIGFGVYRILLVIILLLLVF